MIKVLKLIDDKTTKVDVVLNLTFVISFSSSATKIQERHIFLTNTIGFLPDEQVAYLNSWLIFETSILFWFSGTLLQWFFFMLYNQKFHPFKDILNE